MKRAAFVAGSLFIASAFLLAQDTRDESTQRARILALENAWNQAEQRKDARALDQLVAPTLIYIDYDGTLMDKAQFLASTKIPSLHPEQILNESTSVHMYGNAAVVTGLYTEKGTVKGKRYLRRGRFIDTWINQKGTWQCVSSQSTLISH